MSRRSRQPPAEGGEPPKRGAPAKMRGGRRVNLYLDVQSLAIAQAFGAGNVSEGVRVALRRAQEAQGGVGATALMDEKDES